MHLADCSSLARNQPVLFGADMDFAIVAEPGQIHSHMPGMPRKCLRLSHALCACYSIPCGNDGCSSLPCIWHLTTKKRKTKSIKDVNWTEVSPFRPITTDDWSCPELPGRFMWDQVSRKVRKHVQCRMMPRTGCFKFTTRFRGVLFPKEQLESPP